MEIDSLDTFGAILYRAGRNEEAVMRLKKALSKSPGKVFFYDWLFLAMAHQRLGHTGEAKKCLAKAEALREYRGKIWPQRLQWQFLHREAEDMVKGTKR
jgi:hypothetical protein